MVMNWRSYASQILLQGQLHTTAFQHLIELLCSTDALVHLQAKLKCLIVLCHLEKFGPESFPNSIYGCHFLLDPKEAAMQSI
jgi:hypothetical protein